MSIQGNNLHIFLWNLKIWIFLKKIFWNCKILKSGMPKKKLCLNLKQKNPLFLQYPFLTIF